MEAGEGAEEAGQVAVDSLYVDEGAQAVGSDALWNLRTGHWDRRWTISNLINCYWTTKLQRSAVFAMQLPTTGLTLSTLS